MKYDRDTNDVFHRARRSIVAAIVAFSVVMASPRGRRELEASLDDSFEQKDFP